MAGRNQRDVALVIKARDEATKTFDAVAGALQKLVENQSDLAAGSGAGQNRLQQFTNVLLQLDKAAASTASGFDTAAQSIERMQQRVASNSARYDDLTREAQGLTRVVQILSAEADKAFIGPRRNGLTEALRSAKGDLTTLNREISSLSGAISRDLEGVGSASSPLQQLASTERAVAEASQFARAQIEQETRALRELEAQAQRLTPMQSRINAITGVSRPDATGSASAAADLLLVADAQYRVTQARNADIQKLKQQQAEETALSREREAQRRANQFLAPSGSGKSARESAQVFAEAETAALKQAADAHKQFEDRVRQGAAAMREEEAAVERLRADLDPLAAVTSRASAEQAKLDAWHKRGKISATEYAAATKRLAQETKDAAEAAKSESVNKPRVSLFGLRPYETQNLLYQVNDIVTQLGSGTSLSQTLAQQGGQIFQLFQNRIGPSIAAAFSNPYFLAAGATLGVFVLGLKEAGDQLERMRNAQGTLSSMADGGDYNAKGLTDAAKAMRAYGVASADATKSVQTFVRAGLSGDRLASFGKTAKDMADVLGIEVPEAARKLADGFDGSFDSIQKLDKELNFLTAEQYKNIQAMFDQGNATGALALAADALRDRFGKAADDMRGPWAEAIRGLRSAWQGFLDTLANSAPVQAALNGLTQLVKGASDAINSLNETSVTSLDRRIQSSLSLYRNGLELAAKGKDVGGYYVNQYQAKDGAPPAFADRARELNELLVERARLQREAQVQQERQTAAVRAEAREREGKANVALEEGIDKLREQGKQLSANERLQKAYNDALREAQRLHPDASPARQAEYANAARANEQTKINKEREAAAKAQVLTDESALRSYVQRVIRAENNTGNPAAKNPNSSATGNGQFIASTWLALFEKHFPERARRMGEDAILALRKDAETSKTMIELYARENAAALQKSGNAVTEANLHLAHFLGSGGANKVLKAAPGTRIADLFTDRAGRQAIAANPTILGRGATRESVLAYATRRAGGSRNGGVGETTQNQLEIEARLGELEQDRLNTQERFSEKLSDENERRREQITSLESQRGLQGEALIEEQKRQAVADAVLQKQQELERLNRERATKGLAPIASEEIQKELAEVEKTTRSYQDLARAKDIAAAKRAAVDNPVSELTAQRDAIQQQIEFAQRSGDNSPLAALEASLANVNGRLKEATASQVAFYQSILAGGPAALAQYGLTADAVQTILERIKSVEAAQPNLRTQFLMTGKQINDTFASGAANAFDRFAQKVAAGENVMKSLKDAFLQFASDFLRQIAQMIIKQAIFNAIGGATGTGGGGMGGGISGLIGGLFKHEGGQLGGGRSRQLDPAIFAGAMRLHSGGVPGLGSNEVPAVLERDEEVLTRSDPRHILNGGKNGRAPVVVPAPEVKVVNAIDAGDAMSKGLDTRVGQRAFLNFITANQDAVKQALG